jgi:hypothetical protein
VTEALPKLLEELSSLSLALAWPVVMAMHLPLDRLAKTHGLP